MNFIEGEDRWFVATKNTKITKRKSIPTFLLYVIFVANLIRERLLSFVVFAIFCLFPFGLVTTFNLTNRQPTTEN